MAAKFTSRTKGWIYAILGLLVIWLLAMWLFPIPMTHTVLLFREIEIGKIAMADRGERFVNHFVVGLPKESEGLPNGFLTLNIEGIGSSQKPVSVTYDLNDSTPCNWLDKEGLRGLILNMGTENSELLAIFAKAKAVEIRVDGWTGKGIMPLWMIWLD